MHLPRRRFATLAASLLALAACGAGGSGTDLPPPTPPGAAPAPFEIEVIVRTGENFAQAAEVQAFAAAAAAHRVKVINLLVKQDEDGALPSGSAFYASRIAPVAAGYAQFDVLQAMIDAARPLGLKVYAWMPQFHDQVAARAHPEWQMMALKNGQLQPYTGARSTEYFVNPLLPAVQAYQRSLIDEVLTRYAVDGVMLDWIRFDDFNMDLGAASRQAFMAGGGSDPLAIDFSRDSPARQAWNQFRTDGIAAYVRALRSSWPTGRHLGLYMLPPEFVEVGQDAAKFNRELDALGPMCYHRDWGYPLAWWWNSCMASTVAKAGAAAVVPAMDSALDDADYAQIMARLRADFPKVRRLSWFHHGRWDEARLARIERLSGH